MHLKKFFSAMLLVSGLFALANVGCAEEVLECCKCTYACTDAKGVPVTVCDCSQYTYEECGAFCHNDLPAQLAAQGIMGCEEPETAFAMDACTP